MFALGVFAVMAALATALPSTSLEVKDVQCHPTDTHFVDDPRECHMYFTCYQGAAFPMVCPPGFKFVEALQSCYQVSVEECFQCPETGIVNLPHPKSCQKFVLCFMGVANERQCSDGLLFNPELGQCDLEANVECAL